MVAEIVIFLLDLVVLLHLDLHCGLITAQLLL